MNRVSVQIAFYVLTVILLSGCHSNPLSERPLQITPGDNELRLGKVYTARIKSGPDGGCSLQCVYRLPAPYSEVWKLKTQFENITGISGAISETRIISRTPDIIVYEAKSPQISKWLRTEIKLDAKDLTIKTKLLNPDDMGMKFMNSEIKLKPDGRGTIVSWRNNLSLKFWPDSVAASLMLPQMKDAAEEDRRLFQEIIKSRDTQAHPNYINSRL